MLDKVELAVAIVSVFTSWPFLVSMLIILLAPWGAVIIIQRQMYAATGKRIGDLEKRIAHMGERLHNLALALLAHERGDSGVPGLIEVIKDRGEG